MKYTLVLVALIGLVGCDASSAGSREVSRTTTSNMTIAARDPVNTTSAAGTSPAGQVWPSGTVTCAHLEGNFPAGVDDHRLDLQQGIVTYYDQPDGDEQSIQFMDDPTCSSDSEAWRFMIGYVLDVDRLNATGELCDWYPSLTTLEPPPGNLRTVATHVVAANQLCG